LIVPGTPALLNVAMLRWLDELSNQGIFATDADFVIKSWNHWLQRNTGHLADEVIGRTLFELYPELRERGLERYYKAALEGEVSVLAQSLHRHLLPIPMRLDASGIAPLMPQTARIAPLVHGGRIVGTITAIDDVTERVTREAEMRKQIAAAEEARAIAEDALRTKDEFLATLSHEIRTPLNAVIGWTKILLGRRADPDTMQRALTIIDRNAIAQARLIEDMLDMARIMSGKLRMEFGPVDLVSSTAAAIDVVAPAAAAKGVKIQSELGNEPRAIVADAGRVQQVAWNVLSNAVKFTGSGGTVFVKIEEGPEVVRLVVRDTGEGIAPDFLPHVFERFRQANASASRTEGGLGLGLPLVRQLVELHGGSISIESPGRGQGSTVVVTFPQPRMPADAAPIDILAGRPLEALTVLIVDDDADWCELLSVALSEHGAQIVTASSAKQALAWLSDAGHPLPDVVIADIGMPDDDGYSLVSQLRQLDGPVAQVPAIAVTAYGGADNVRKAYESGFQMHRAKPLTPVDVAMAVIQVLRIPPIG
jgi:signal transduction histidine kinase/CheY-like chemotaxis protein